MWCIRILELTRLLLGKNAFYFQTWISLIQSNQLYQRDSKYLKWHFIDCVGWNLIDNFLKKILYKYPAGLWSRLFHSFCQCLENDRYYATRYQANRLRICCTKERIFFPKSHIVFLNGKSLFGFQQIGVIFEFTNHKVNELITSINSYNFNAYIYRFWVHLLLLGACLLHAC